MNKPGPFPAPPRVFSAGWHIVRTLVKWLSSVLALTEHDFREAGVYLGAKRE